MDRPLIANEQITAQRALLPEARPAPRPLARVAPADDSPLPLDAPSLALSLPIAICLGQLNVPAAAGWAALLILYKAAAAPGVVRGTLDFLVDGLAIDGDVRARLGVPPAQRQPRTTVAGGLPAAVRGWQAAIAARRDANPPASGESDPPTATPAHLGSLLDLAADSTDSPHSLADALARLPAVLPIRTLAIDPRPLAVPLGQTPRGETIWVDLAEDVVNVGVYGTTGAGKDLLLLQWFTLLCRRNPPEDVQFIVLDGKGDWLLPQMQGLAHMRVDPAGGYGNLAAVTAALAVIHAEAQARERQIFGGGFRSREHYCARTGQSLPLLVVIVTDLMTSVQGMVEEALAELISKARALGIRVVMSFQNPTGKAMAWRSNIGLVLAGCMVDGSQDPVVLGIRKLQDMRYRPSQLPNPKKSDPATKGLFVVRHGSDQYLIKTPYLDDDALLALCARLPRRAAGRWQEAGGREPEAGDREPQAEGRQQDHTLPHPSASDRPAPTHGSETEGAGAPAAHTDDDLLAALLHTVADSPAPQAGTITAPTPTTSAGSHDGATNWIRTRVETDGRTIHIHNLVAVRSGGGSRVRRRGSRVNVQRMRERAAKYQQIQTLVAQGKSANQIDRAIPGERKVILALVRRAKAEQSSHAGGAHRAPQED